MSKQLDDDVFAKREKASQKLIKMMTPEIAILLAATLRERALEGQERIKRKLIPPEIVEKIAAQYPFKFKGYKVQPWIDAHIYNSKGMNNVEVPFLDQDFCNIAQRYLAKGRKVKKQATTPKQFPAYGLATQLLFDDWTIHNTRQVLSSGAFAKMLHQHINKKNQRLMLNVSRWQHNVL